MIQTPQGKTPLNYRASSRTIVTAKCLYYKKACFEHRSFSQDIPCAEMTELSYRNCKPLELSAKNGLHSNHTPRTKTQTKETKFEINTPCIDIGTFFNSGENIDRILTYGREPQKSGYLHPELSNTDMD